MPTPLKNILKLVLFLVSLLLVLFLFFLSTLASSGSDYTGTNVYFVEGIYLLKTLLPILITSMVLGVLFKIIYRDIKIKVISTIFLSIFLLIVSFNLVISWISWSDRVLLGNYPNAINKLYTHRTSGIDSRGCRCVDFITNDKPGTVFDFYKNHPSKTPSDARDYELQQTTLNGDLWKSIYFEGVAVNITHKEGQPVKVEIF